MTKYDNIGEAVEILEDGTCPHPYLVPDINGEKCALVQRIDVVSHHITTGGYQGHKDYMDTMAKRIAFFENYAYKNKITESILDEEFNKLIFKNKVFMDRAHDICGIDKPILDIDEMFFNVRVPGQVAPLHIDAPFFHGASRFLFPHWLLVAMQESKMYQDILIPQVQVIAYVHQWEWNKNDGGEFLWFDKGNDYDPIVIPPTSRSAIFTDGSQTVHASQEWKESKQDLIPKLSYQNKKYELEYIDNKQWRLYSYNLENNTYIRHDDDDIILNESDIRMAIVIRAKCYSSESEKNGYNAKEEKNNLTISKILNDFIDDMKKKNVYNNEGQKKHLSPAENALELALKILSEYIAMPYPYKYAWIPINFCMIPELNNNLQWLKKTFFSYFCN